MQDPTLQKLVVRIAAAVVCGTFLFVYAAGRPIVIDVAGHSEKKTELPAINREATKPITTNIALQDAEPVVRTEPEPSKPAVVSQLARPDKPQADTRRRSAPQQKTGTIRGRVVFKGTPPDQKLLFEGLPKADPAFCGQFELFDESMIVNPLNNGIKNVFVYLVSKMNSEVIWPQPELAARTALVGCRVEPRCTLVQTRQEFQFHQVDSVPHNMATFSVTNQIGAFPPIPPGGMIRFTFDRAEFRPFQFKCAIHPWMSGWILVTDHPFAAITDADGKFEIPDIPYGKHKFRIYHERAYMLHRGALITVNSESIELPDFEFEASKFGY